MISRKYTFDTRDAVINDMEEAMARTVRTLGDLATEMEGLPVADDMAESDGSGKVIVTASGSPTFLSFFKEQFGIKEGGGLATEWKIVKTQPLRINALVTVAQVLNNDATGIEGLGSHPHRPGVRFNASARNAERAAVFGTLPSAERRARAAYEGAMGSTAPNAVDAAMQSANAARKARDPYRILTPSSRAGPWPPGNVASLVEEINKGPETLGGGYRKTRRRQMKKRTAARRTNKNRRTH
jgi:hypothetical protein